MPPFLNWYRGRETVAAFLVARALAAPDRWRAIPVGANGQPAAGLYRARTTAATTRARSRCSAPPAAGSAGSPRSPNRACSPLFGLPLIFPNVTDFSRT